MPIGFWLLSSIMFLTTFTQKAFAHPHIWVYTDVGVIVHQNNITGFNVTWNFDELYSAAFMQDADTNKNMQLEPVEAEETIQKVFIENPANLFPFIHIKLNGKDKKYQFKKPTIKMGEDETLYYTFSIILDEPTPITGAHEFGFFDPEFYVSFEQSYTLDLPQPSKCEYNLKENKNIFIYDGLVNPETYTLNCKGA